MAFNFEGRIQRLRELQKGFQNELNRYDKGPDGLLGQHGFDYGVEPHDILKAIGWAIQILEAARDGKRPVYRPKPRRKW